MRFVAASFIHILTILCAVSAFGAEEITHISVIQADTGRETALERRLPVGLTHPKIGDRVVLHAGKSGNYIVEVTESRRSKFGNSIVHGVTPSGGSSLLVFSPAGSVTGNLYAYDGKVQITTENEVTTAWRLGIDALPITIDDGGIAPPAERLIEAVSMRELDDRAASKQRTAPTAQAREGEYILPSFKVGPHVIDVLMYYDESLFDASGVIDYVIELTNDALKNSEVSATVSVVAMKPVTVSSSHSNRDLLNKLKDGSAPFERIGEDAQEEGADLLILLRGDKAQNEGNCGIAQLGFSRGAYSVTARAGVAEWRPAGRDWICSEFAMAHEIGHLLGAKHQRNDYDEESSHSATSYSYGYVMDSSETIMATKQSEEVPFFSNPDVSCRGVPCGSKVPDRFELSNGANNARAFRLTTPSIAGREGDSFSFESVSVFPVDGEYAECEDDGESGFWKAYGISNNYKEEISWAEVHYISADGSARSYSFDKGEFSIPPGYRSYRGWCNTEGNSNVTNFVESFARYYHPDTGELVETGHVYFEDDYDGDYSTLRIATSSGGTVIGHPEQSLRVGGSHVASLIPETGYRLARLETNCEGQETGDSFRVNATADDCRIEAFFEQDTECNTFGDAGAYVQKIFIAYLGRPAAPAGLEYFANYLSSDMEQGKLILFDDLYYSAEAAELYRESSLTDQLNQFYQFMFARDAQRRGLMYWVAQIETGEFTVPASAAYIADAASGEDMDVLDAKQRAASKLTCAIGNDAAKLRGFQSNLAAVRESLSSITTAEEASAYDGEAELDRIINGG